MYRSDGEEAISYTTEDLLLYKESPFASWMERLTLENPLHGISPDESSVSLGNHRSTTEFANKESLISPKLHVESVQWGDLVDHRAHLDTQTPRMRQQLKGIVDVGDEIYVIKKIDDVRRRQETLDAMRSGVSIIVNAHLAVGPLSGDVDLLLRSSGVSELGNYLYLPCDVSACEKPHSALALCCAADLLHSMQGVLPPQMLVICAEREPLCLTTEDHIYHYHAVKKSFMIAQGSFRSHCIPNPEDSSSFGRWVTCANDVMKRRAKYSSNDVPALELCDPPSTQLRSVANVSVPDSYVDSDWPGTRRDISEQHIFNDRLMTSNGTDF